VGEARRVMSNLARGGVEVPVIETERLRVVQVTDSRVFLRAKWTAQPASLKLAI